MGWVRDPLSSRAWEVPGRSGLQEAPGPGARGGEEPTPSGKSKSRWLHVLRAQLGDRSWETENHLTPQPVGRWGPDADPPISWQHPQQIGLCFGEEKGTFGA